MSKTNQKILLQETEFIPKMLEPGILYYSREFGIAAHMCPCGCGSKVVTPITPVNWSLKIKKGEPTLDPSLGNWELPCRSHYWIWDGEIVWAEQWSNQKIKKGREFEQKKMNQYYSKPKKKSAFRKFIDWLRGK